MKTYHINYDCDYNIIMIRYDYGVPNSICFIGTYGMQRLTPKANSRHIKPN